MNESDYIKQLEQRAYHPLVNIHNNTNNIDTLALRFTNDSTDEPLYTIIRLALIELQENAKRGKSTAKILKVLHKLSVPYTRIQEESNELEMWKPNG